MSREGELAERLAAIVTELDDLIFERLQAALEDGATTRPASDRVRSQARRAVEKAQRLLAQLDAADSAGGCAGGDDGASA